MGHCFNDQRHTITGLLSCAGRLNDDWSADYRMYDDVDNQRLFEPIVQRIRRTIPAEASLILSVDDTLLKKTGRQVAMAGWYRDPLGPAFHTNLIYALKMVQVSMAVPDEQYIRRFRTIPVAGEILPKAPKDATDVERKAYSPSHCALRELRAVRKMLGDDSHKLILCGDAHYTTDTLLGGLDDDVTYIGRFRKDAALFEAIDANETSGPGRPRRYGRKLPMPEELRKDKSIPWSEAKIRRGKKLATIRYKRYARVKWRPAGEKRTVQVVVIAPLRRGRGKQGQWKYTQPAYLLCTDANLPIETLIEAYLIRWGIEVNFREEKQLFGIGQAQVRNHVRVANAPVVALAAYAALALAGHETFNESRKPMHLQTGRWQRRGRNCSYRTSDLRKQLYSEAALHHVDAFNYHSPLIKRSSAIA